MEHGSDGANERSERSPAVLGARDGGTKRTEVPDERDDEAQSPEVPVMPARHHILSVLVENKFGVLSRVAGLFARRGFNIVSLAVSPTEDERFSRMTIVVDADSAPLEQITKQLNKLIPVLKIAELHPDEAVERELMLVTVKATAELRSQITELASIFQARIDDVGHDALTIQVAGAPQKLDAMTDLLQPFGIIELQRTGRIALPKLARRPPKLRAVKNRAADTSA